MQILHSWLISNKKVMRAAIFYSSKHGTTEKISNYIKERLDGYDIELIELTGANLPEVNEYDLVILGGSIHVGKIQDSISEFCSLRESELLYKKVGLFICGMLDEKLQEEFDNAYSDTMKEHSIASGIFGGELLFEKMNILERFVVKRVTKVSSTVSKIDYHSIDEFIEKIRT